MDAKIHDSIISRLRSFSSNSLRRPAIPEKGRLIFQSFSENRRETERKMCEMRKKNLCRKYSFNAHANRLDDDASETRNAGLKWGRGTDFTTSPKWLHWRARR